MDSDMHSGLFGRQRRDTMDENRGSFALSRTTAMLVLATICVVLRFWCRTVRGAKYASDDWVLLAALVCPLPIPVSEFSRANIGDSDVSSMLT